MLLLFIAAVSPAASWLVGRPWQFGTVVDGLAAVGTTGALIATAWVLRSEQRERLEAHASTISAWVDSYNWFGGEGTLALSNASKAPAYSVVVVIVIEAQPTVDLTQPDGEPRLFTQTNTHLVLPPATEPAIIDFYAPARERLEIDDGDPMLIYQWVFLQFRDSRGQIWQRDHRGLLHRRPAMNRQQVAGWAWEEIAAHRGGREEPTAPIDFTDMETPEADP
jgi:hypothetical protein